jgi:hypothetical protein
LAVDDGFAILFASGASLHTEPFYRHETFASARTRDAATDCLPPNKIVRNPQIGRSWTGLLEIAAGETLSPPDRGGFLTMVRIVASLRSISIHSKNGAHPLPVFSQMVIISSFPVTGSSIRL